MKEVEVTIHGRKMMIGQSPQLIVDLDTQENYIKIQERKIPYRRNIQFSPDLLSGKRKNVFHSAVNHYYKQACEVAEGIMVAEEYRKRANTTVREVK
ncbi:MAG: hypothetical protein KH828_09370 [Clostridiales bacterium]|nr:hypothetical protein [Clostridiales bacterium]